MYKKITGSIFISATLATFTANAAIPIEKLTAEEKSICLKAAIVLDDENQIINLLKAGAELNNFTGKTEDHFPLYYAVIRGKVTATKVLLERKANVFETIEVSIHHYHGTDIHYETAFDAAAHSSNPDTILLLLQAAQKALGSTYSDTLVISKITVDIHTAAREQKSSNVEAFIKAITNLELEKYIDVPITTAKNSLEVLLQEEKSLFDFLIPVENKHEQRVSRATKILHLLVETRLMRALNNKEQKIVAEFSEKRAMHPSMLGAITGKSRTLDSIKKYVTSTIDPKSLRKALTAINNLPQDEQTQAMKLSVIRALATLSDEQLRSTEQDHCDSLAKKG